MKRIILGFTGLMSSGKSLAADYLVDKHNYQRVKFAGALKAMAYAIGLTHDHIEGHLKEEPCSLIGGRTPRYFMQTLGTEFGRNMIDPDLWIRAWQHQVGLVPTEVPIVADDCRFPNEADAIKKTASVGKIYRIVRVGVATGAHASELQTFAADSTVYNDGTPEDLYKKLDLIVSRTNRTAKYT